MKNFVLIVAIALGIATLAALYLQRRGYTLARSFITWFLAAAGILSLLFKLIRDYL